MRDMLRRDIRPKTEADNRGVAVGENGYFMGPRVHPWGSIRREKARPLDVVMFRWLCPVVFLWH